MGRAETIVQLTADLRERLDAEAGKRGISRSALIREAAESYLLLSSEASVTRSIVEGYTRIPQTTPDAWGDLPADMDQATSDLLARLDDEEHKAGLPPW